MIGLQTFLIRFVAILEKSSGGEVWLTPVVDQMTHWKLCSNVPNHGEELKPIQTATLKKIPISIENLLPL